MDYKEINKLTNEAIQELYPRQQYLWAGGNHSEITGIVIEVIKKLQTKEEQTNDKR